VREGGRNEAIVVKIVAVGRPWLKTQPGARAGGRQAADKIGEGATA